MPPALHTDTLVVPLAELPPYQEKLSEYQAKLPELKQRVGDRERDQFISGLTERLRSVSVVTSSSNPAVPQRLGHQGTRVLAALAAPASVVLRFVNKFFVYLRPHSAP